jgi:anti-anti-sigma factor
MRWIHLTRPRGHVDVAVVEGLGMESFDVLDGDIPEIVVIDLADVLVLDPTAVTALIYLRRRLQSHEGFLLLRGASPHLQTMLAVTGLDRAFPDADLPAPPDRS